MSEERSEYKSAMEVGKQLGAKVGVSMIEVPWQDGTTAEVPVAMVPNDMKCVVMKELMPADSRMTGTLDVYRKMDTIESFIEYVDRFKNANTVIFADGADLELTAMIDYEKPGDIVYTPYTHRVTYGVGYTWVAEAWLKINRKNISQDDFAEFLLERGRDIVATDELETSAADVYEVARNLKATIRSHFEKSVNLQNGSVNLVWNEDVKGQIRNGETEIPSEFNITIPIFKGQPPVDITVHLRFRIQQGELTFYVQLMELPEVRENMFAASVEMVRERLVDTPVYFGKE